jgi:hypothetical protein
MVKGEKLKRHNAESVRQFQPRVALWQPWENASISLRRNFEGVAPAFVSAKPRNPFQGCELSLGAFLPRVSKQTLG